MGKSTKKRGRGQPPKGYVRLQVRLPPAARDRLEELAGRWGCSLGEAIDVILRRRK